MTLRRVRNPDTLITEITETVRKHKKQTLDKIELIYANLPTSLQWSAALLKSTDK